MGEIFDDRECAGTFGVVWALWIFQLRALSKKIPRNLKLVTVGIGLLQKFSSKFIGRRFLVNTNTAHLSTEKLRPHVEAQVLILLIYGCKMLRATAGLSDEVWNSISSAKRDVEHVEIGLGKSYIKIIHRVGLRTAPWGTPRLSMAGEENWLLIRTENERSKDNFLTN